MPSEADIAAIAVAELRAADADVYQEVEHHSGRIFDIVAVYPDNLYGCRCGRDQAEMRRLHTPDVPLPRLVLKPFWHPEQRDATQAGLPSAAGRSTRFTRSMAMLRRQIARSGPIPLANAIDLAHPGKPTDRRRLHWASKSGAVAGVKSAIERGYGHGLRLVDGNLVLAPMTEESSCPCE